MTVRPALSALDRGDTLPARDATGADGRPLAVLGPLFMPWAAGPVENASAVVVSVTDFTTARLPDAPGVVRAGLRLRRGWYAMPGAVGLWLWSLPLERRSGSVSVWTSEEDLRRFVALPAHLAIMRRFSKAGTLRSEKWREERFVPADTILRARRWIADALPSAP